jgi:hypothetical protein
MLWAETATNELATVKEKTAMAHRNTGCQMVVLFIFFSAC